MRNEFAVELHEGDRQWLPQKSNPTDAGYDLKARAFTFEDKTSNTPEEDGHAKVWVLYPGEPVLVKTGVKLQLRPGWEAQIRPRSGLALKQGITVANAPGTIDAGYRGEIGVILINLTSVHKTIRVGERIAQMVIKSLETATLVPVETVDETERGEGGFGSTGL